MTELPHNRLEEIQHQYDQIAPEDRDPSDVAIGELLAALKANPSTRPPTDHLPMGEDRLIAAENINCSNGASLILHLRFAELHLLADIAHSLRELYRWEN